MKQQEIDFANFLRVLFSDITCYHRVGIPGRGYLVVIGIRRPEKSDTYTLRMYNDGARGTSALIELEVHPNGLVDRERILKWLIANLEPRISSGDMILMLRLMRIHAEDIDI